MTDVYRRNELQTPRMSLVESIVNVAVGFCLALALNAIVLPWFGYAPTLADNITISGIFTAVSVARSFLLRRAFEVWL